MGWETRRNGKTYYYRKTKRNGTVISEFIGRGPIAELAANLDAVDRHQRTVRRLEFQELVEADRRADAALDRFRRHVRAYVRAELAQAGYHLHKRGEWRKAQDMTKTTEITKPEIDIGSLARAVQSEILRCAGVGKSADVRKMILDEMDALREGLGWADAPVHERLLIDAIALSWLRVHLMEQFLAQNTMESGYKMHIAEHFERRLSAAHRRYVASIAALARVRQVNIQINIAQQQIVASRIALLGKL